MNKFLSREILAYEFLSNTIELWMTALFALVVFLILFGVVHSVILSRLRRLADKTETDIDNMLVEILSMLRPPFYAFLSFFLALKFLSFPPIADTIIEIVLIVWATYLAIKAIHILIIYILAKSLGEEEDPGAQSAREMLGMIAKGALWALGGMLILSNLGVNINSLIAGLGIGGVAIALALQNILGDLFSSFAIYFDKPFVLGDFIVIGDKMGVVEHIGVKTTRLKALQGEQIIFSNKELTTAQIQNFKRMRERRAVFSFGVTHEIPLEQLKKIPLMIRDIIGAQKTARFDRAHFNRFAASSLDFEVVYYVLTPDYNEYMDTHQAILFRIKDQFEQNGISMAYPAQTLYMHTVRG